eukprot:Colp12_sorted_trinity150504_noHs@25240
MIGVGSAISLVSSFFALERGAGDQAIVAFILIPICVWVLWAPFRGKPAQSAHTIVSYLYVLIAIVAVIRYEATMYDVAVQGPGLPGFFNHVRGLFKTHDSIVDACGYFLVIDTVVLTTTLWVHTFWESGLKAGLRVIVLSVLMSPAAALAFQYASVESKIAKSLQAPVRGQAKKKTK